MIWRWAACVPQATGRAHLKDKLGLAWWHMPIILGLKKSPQAKASLNYIAKPCVIKQPTQQTQTSIQK